DWSWVEALMRRTESSPGWYRELSQPERDTLGKRFWGEGRLKLEPWLAPRLARQEIRLWPEDHIVGAQPAGDGIALALDRGARVETDYVLFATGYRVDLARVPFLIESGLVSRIEVKNGFPCLDTAMQSSMDGLYFTSLPATQDFGAFFGFTVSARTSSRLIGDDLASKR